MRVPNWVHSKTIGECAYCHGEIYNGDEFYASGSVMLCCVEHRDAFIAEHPDEYDIDDFIHWQECEFDLDTERKNWREEQCL